MNDVYGSHVFLKNRNSGSAAFSIARSVKRGSYKAALKRENVGLLSDITILLS
jgi:hypothetical protein